jgi:decaprenylphospho-beta-D-erythro-pentofuranosid-2-ulose 2-reductase
VRVSFGGAAQPPHLLVLGATSAIASATIRRCATKGASLYLVARNPEKLKVIAQDATVRGARLVHVRACDLNDSEQHPDIIADARRRLSRVDIALIAHGVLGDQVQMQKSFATSELNFRTNFLSVVSLLTTLANDFESVGTGTIAIISSIAGDRGRKSNYIYGSAKAGISAYLQGLRNRLASRGVHVLTIKPGFVRRR